MEKFLLALLKSELFKSLMSSIGGDFVKEKFKELTKHKEKDENYLLISAFEETFEKFYSKKNMEFEPSIVMDALFEIYNNLKIDNIEKINREMLEHILYPLDCSEADLESFIYFLCKTLAQPKYLALKNELELRRYIQPFEEKNNKWMNTYMKDNWCLINIPNYEKIYDMFEKIKTSLDPRVWIAVQDVIYELFYNAQKHGNATICKLKIDVDALYIIDNGQPFNPQRLIDEGGINGGALAYGAFLNKCKKVKTDYISEKGFNTFSITFESPFFDVNGLSEIIIPNFIDASFLVRLFDGEFKYCYIDMCDSFMGGKRRISAYSGFTSLYIKLNEMLKCNEFEKIYLYFSNTDPNTIYGEMYDKCKYVFESRNNPAIELVVV